VRGDFLKSQKKVDEKCVSYAEILEKKGNKGNGLQTLTLTTNGIKNVKVFNKKLLHFYDFKFCSTIDRIFGFTTFHAIFTFIERLRFTVSFPRKSFGIDTF